MQQGFAVRGLAALAAALLLFCLPGCGGSGSSTPKATQVVVTPTMLSLNEGAVGTLSAVAESSTGATVAADITFTSSNPSVATVSAGGLVCAGAWDSSFINCNATIGQAGVGQVTITATATAFGVSSTATVYVHLQVDQVQAVLANSCTSMGEPIAISGKAFSTTAPGCSPSAPCDITSTVGPFTFGSSDNTVAASSAGIQSTFSSSTMTPTYVSGGTITGSKGQTCNLSNFNGVTGATGTVALTGTNAIAGGTQLTITNPGSGATTAPTTATLSNGTATCSGTANVKTAITAGQLTAEVPGSTTLFASVSGVNSVGAPYLTCPVTAIAVHDASSLNASFTLNPKGTQALTADVFDSNGHYITPTLVWGSSTSAVASVAATGSGNNPGTVTAVTGGTTYITASCSYPNCNIRIPPQYSLNVATVNVTQTGFTTVYAASTNSTSLVPINTGTNTAGTAITLPHVPNSIVADAIGVNVYLGSDSGVMQVTVSTGAVTTFTATGHVIAVAPNGLFLLVSNDTAGVIGYVNTVNGALTTTPATTSSSAYTPDSLLNEWVSGTNFGFGPETGFSGTVALPSAANALDIAAQGGLTYISSAAGRQVFVYATCNQSPEQTTPLVGAAPTLLKALPNGTGAVAVDSPNIDVISTPSVLNANCPVTNQSTLKSYPLNAGSFTAQQLLVSPDATRAWIVSNLPELLEFNLPTLTPATVPLAGGATGLSAALTDDGAVVYVGTSDGTVHGVVAASGADVVQIPVGLKDGNGNPTTPNLVALVP